jgi:hypothetical protein
VSQFILYYDAIVIFRYLFIFRLKNPAAFKEDFWSLFVFVWVLVLLS